MLFLGEEALVTAEEPLRRQSEDLQRADEALLRAYEALLTGVEALFLEEQVLRLQSQHLRRGDEALFLEVEALFLEVEALHRAFEALHRAHEAPLAAFEAPFPRSQGLLRAVEPLRRGASRRSHRPPRIAEPQGILASESGCAPSAAASNPPPAPMGLTHVTVKLRSMNGAGAAYEADFLVDTGASDSMAPAPALERAGFHPVGTMSYELADGTIREFPFGLAVIEFMGDVTAGRIIFGPQDAEPILGVTALESVGILVDPANKTLRRLPAVPLK